MAKLILNVDAKVALDSIRKHIDEVIKGLDYLANLELTSKVEGDIIVVTPKPAPTPTPTPVTGRKIPWGKQCQTLHPDFLDGVLWIESQLNLKAENLIACMKFESNLNPKARNPKSSASGLIQFMAGTARNLGTSIEHIRSLGAMEQLSWVYKYFKAFGSDLGRWDIADTYMAILWPAGIGKPMSHKIFVDNARKANDAYDVNKGLDKNKDGFVTKQEAAQKVIDLYNEGMKPSNVLVI